MIVVILGQQWDRRCVLGKLLARPRPMCMMVRRERVGTTASDRGWEYPVAAYHGGAGRMDLDDLQKPNIGKPDYAKGRSTAERKTWAIVTTIAFAVFWFSGLFLAAGLYGQQDLHWSVPVLTVLGLGVGLFARRRVDER
ncbi:MAG: hypothetical protein AAGH83_11185 [Pseudomonadota bacterium]